MVFALFLKLLIYKGFFILIKNVNVLYLECSLQTKFTRFKNAIPVNWNTWFENANPVNWITWFKNANPVNWITWFKNAICVILIIVFTLSVLKKC